MSRTGLDGVASLNPTFTTYSNANNASGVASPSDDPLKRKEREALRMAHVLKGLAAQRRERQEAEKLKARALDSEREKDRAARRRDFLAKRGRPAPAPRPSWAHEADARAFNADREALNKAAAKDNSQVRASRQMGADRDARKAAFKAMRRGDASPQAERGQEAQTLKPETARAFSRERDQSPSNGFRRAASETPVPQRPPTIAPRRTSFARTIDR